MWKYNDPFDNCILCDKKTTADEGRYVTKDGYAHTECIERRKKADDRSVQNDKGIKP